MNWLLIAVFPIAGLVLGLWVLYLNRLSPEQRAVPDDAAQEDARAEYRDLTVRLERLEKVVQQRPSVSRSSTSGRLVILGGHQGHRLRPEARAALSRVQPAE